jgi:protocatechuate 3,4-dioxygenase beta subunit
MTPDTISLRRRQLLVAGAAAPMAAIAGYCVGAPLGVPAVAESGAVGSGAGAKLIISGRVLRGDHKPLAGAVVETWRADGEGGQASAITDADGRFMFTTIIAPAVTSARPLPMHYRVSHAGHETLVSQLHFAREPGIPGDRIAQLQRDEAGTWRATFGVALA